MYNYSLEEEKENEEEKHFEQPKISQIWWKHKFTDSRNMKNSKQDKNYT